MTSATPSPEAPAPAATATTTSTNNTKSVVLAQLALPHASVAERSDELRFEAPVSLSGFRLDSGGGGGGFEVGSVPSSLLSVFARDLETPTDARLACVVSRISLESSSASTTRTFAVEPAIVTDKVVLRGRYGAIRGAFLGVDLASASASSAALASASPSDKASSWKQRREAAVSRWKDGGGARRVDDDEEGAEGTIRSLRDLLRRSALTLVVSTRVSAAEAKKRAPRSAAAAAASAAISAAAAAWREKQEGALPSIAETVAALEREGGEGGTGDRDETMAVDDDDAAADAAASAAVAWCRAPFSTDAASSSNEAAAFASAGAALAAAAGESSSPSSSYARALCDAGFVEAAGDLLSLFASSSSSTSTTSVQRPSFETLSSLLLALGAISSVEPAATSEALLGWRREATGNGAATTTKPATPTTPFESLVASLSRRALQVPQASFEAGKAAVLRAAVHSAAADFASAAGAAAAKVDVASASVDGAALPPFDLRAAASALSATTKAAEALARALGRTAAISSPSAPSSGREAELAFALSPSPSSSTDSALLLPPSRSPDAAAVVSLASRGVWACAALAAAVPAAVAARAAAAASGGGGALPEGTTEEELSAALALPLSRALVRLVATASASPRGVAALVSAKAGGVASAEALLSLASSLDGRGDEKNSSRCCSPFASTAGALRASLAAAAHAADLSAALKGEEGDEDEDEAAAEAARSLVLLTATDLGRKAVASALLSSDDESGDDSSFGALLALLDKEQQRGSGLALLCAELVRVSAAEAERGCCCRRRNPLAPRWLMATKAAFVRSPAPSLSSPSSCSPCSALAEALALTHAASEAASAPSPAAALLGCVASLSASLPPLVSPPPEAPLPPPSSSAAARSAALLLPAPGAAAAFVRDPALSAGACARLSLISAALSGRGGRQGAALLLCCDGNAVDALSSSMQQQQQQSPLPLPRPSLSGAAVLEAAVRTATGALEASNADLGGWCATAGDAVDACGLVSSRARAALLCRSSASALQGALEATTARRRGQQRNSRTSPMVLFRGRKTLDALLRLHREISSSPESLSVGIAGAFSVDHDDEEKDGDLPGVRDDPIARDLLAARAHCVRALSHWLAGRGNGDGEGGEKVPDLVAAVVSAGREPPFMSAGNGDDDGGKEEGPPPPPPLSPAENYTSLLLLGDLMPSEWPPPGAAASLFSRQEPSKSTAAARPHPPPRCVRRRAALARAFEPSAQEIHSLLCSASLSGPGAARAALVRLCARASGLGGGMGAFVCGPLVDALAEASSAVSGASTAVAIVGSEATPDAAPADPLPAAVGAARAALECLVPLSYRPAAKAALLDLGCAGVAARLLARLVPLLGGEGDSSSSPLALSASAAVTMALETCAALCDPSICLDPSIPLVVSPSSCSSSSAASASAAARGAPGRDTPPRSQGASLAAVLLASLASMGNNAHVARRVFEAVLSCDDDGDGDDEKGQQRRHRHGAATLAAGAAKWKGQVEGTSTKEELASTGSRSLLLWAAEKLRESVAPVGEAEGSVAEVVEAVASSLERAADKEGEGGEGAGPPSPAVDPAPRRFAAAVSASLKAASAAAGDSGKKREVDSGAADDDEDILRGADFEDEENDDEGEDDDLDSVDDDLIPFSSLSASGEDPVAAAASSAFDAPTRIFWRNVAARAADGAASSVPLELPSWKAPGAAPAAATPLLAWDLPPAQKLEPATAALVDGLAPRKRARGVELAPSVSAEDRRVQRQRQREQAAAVSAVPENGAPAPIAVIERTTTPTMDEDLPPGV